MTRPSAETLRRVDALVAALDRDTSGASFGPPATSSYAVIVVAWLAFKKLVDGIDVAIGRPFDEGAADIFLAADALVANEAHRLAFWLQHVGEALNRA